MPSTAKSLLEVQFDAPRRPDLDSGLREKPEGAALRELHALLVRLDPDRRWGAVRRVPTPTGGYLWLCLEHYPLYDPGRPKLD